MAGADPQTAARVIAGRYRLAARRGSGVDAAVFDAFDMQLQRSVAVKLVHPDVSADPAFQRRFREVMDVVAGLHHPNLATVYDWGTDTWDGRPVLFVVVEHLAGGSLRELFDRGRLLSPSQALVVGLDACRGLDAIHRAGLTHGDIRPSTLVFGDDRRLRVIDVGLGGLLTDQLWAHPEDLPNERAAYAAPELATGLGRVAASDVYSLCLTLLETVTGQVPFVGESAVATLANRVGKLMPVSADLGPLASVLERAGRPEIADRSTSAELGRALVQTAEKLPRPAPIPILSSGVVAEQLTPGAAVDPTGPLRRPAQPAHARTGEAGETPTAHVAAVASDAPAAPPSRRRRRQLPRSVIAVLALLAALLTGVVAYVATHASSSSVPALAGLSEGEARNRAAGAGFEVLVTSEASDSVAAGTVIRTQPRAGARVSKGTSLQLVVSTGPAPRSLPDLVGMTLADAATALAAEDLVLTEAAPVFDENVPAGAVVSWSVPEQPALKAGDTVTPGTTVLVVPSAGPQPRTVPALDGFTEAQVTSALQVLDLTLVRLPDEFSNSVPAGAVVRQDPAAGQTAPRGSAVSVVFSRGPDLVPFPTLPSAGLDAITVVLQQAGFVVGTVTGDPAGSLSGATVGGTPATATQPFPRGSAVDLTFGP